MTRNRAARNPITFDFGSVALPILPMFPRLILSAISADRDAPIRGKQQLQGSRPIHPADRSRIGIFMTRNPILELPLNEVMRSEIALPLQHVLQLYTVGSLLNAWRNPRNHRSIEQVFDSPVQAHHAIAVCAAWLGVQTPASPNPVSGWWEGAGGNAEC